ncbi:hypothetical protein AVL48_34725 [Amycolatopsis regifaucium]|uniref:Uncharacterized protein n=1 Tax=Amycolatopsis regifaucium TaxID=546365 RepID=A0A154MH75_9PSEU|nr:hypothetical protein AVL48_34725 [Amycolatopsis regifaucium]
MAAVGGAGVAAFAVIRGLRRAAHGPADDHDERWLAVTVNRAPEEVGSAGSLPGPLARLGDEIELRIVPAAGDKGTELRARPAGTEVSRGDLRSALRKAKSLIETGIVLEADPPSAHPGPLGKVLRKVTRNAQKGGRL